MERCQNYTPPDSLQKHAPQDYLPMFAPENPIYIAIDTTDIERPGAKKTPYVGYIREKKGEGVVRGFSILMAGTVHRKRVIFLCYHSSAGQKSEPDNDGGNR